MSTQSPRVRYGISLVQRGPQVHTWNLDTIAEFLSTGIFIRQKALFVPGMRGDTDLDTHTHTVKKLIEIL